MKWSRILSYQRVVNNKGQKAVQGRSHFREDRKVVIFLFHLNDIIMSPCEAASYIHFHDTHHSVYPLQNHTTATRPEFDYRRPSSLLEFHYISFPFPLHFLHEWLDLWKEKLWGHIFHRLLFFLCVLTLMLLGMSMILLKARNRFSSATPCPFRPLHNLINNLNDQLSIVWFRVEPINTQRSLDP